MTYFNCFLISLFTALTTTAHTMTVKNETSFCAAVNSILSLDVFSTPLHIHFVDETFGNCLRPTHTTYYVTNISSSASAAPISESVLVTVTSVEQLLEINFDFIDHNGHHLMVIENESSSNTIDELIGILWKKFFINVTLLVIKHSNILLQTFVPFNDAKCNDLEPKVINQFDQNIREWQNDQFFPDKLHNFHHCRLTVTTYKNVVPYIVSEKYIDGKRILSGRVIEMIGALANTLNFTAELDYHPSISAYETCMRKVANRQADLFIGNLFLDLNRISYVDFSVPIFFEFLKFVVPPGRSYSQFENLSRTFDTQTWILILCAVLSSAVIVLVISISSKDIKVEAFGVGYDNGFMDFVADIFGMSRMSIPDLTIPRLIIVKFVIFTFVIRTLYQASIFKFLNSDGRLKAAQSVDEIIGRGYTVYSLTLYENHLKSASRKFVNLSDLDVLLEKISNSNFNGALMHTGSLLMYNNGLKNRNFTNVFCKEDFMTIAMVAYLPKNSYLTEVVNEKIGLFHNAGLIDIWDRRSKNATQMDAEKENKLKHLTVSDLKAIFLIYLMALGVSILVFVWEIVYEHVKRPIRNFGMMVVEC